MKNNDIQGQYMQIFHRIARLRLDPLFHDISEGEFAVLQKIYRHTEEYPDAEEISVSEIAFPLGVTSPAISRMVRVLEKKNYVQRLESRRDRRHTLLRLTDEGEAVRKNTFSVLKEYFRRVSEHMGQKRMAELSRLSEQLYAVMEEELVRYKYSDRHSGRSRTEKHNRKQERR